MLLTEWSVEKKIDYRAANFRCGRVRVEMCMSASRDFQTKGLCVWAGLNNRIVPLLRPALHNIIPLSASLFTTIIFSKARHTITWFVVICPPCNTLPCRSFVRSFVRSAAPCRASRTSGVFACNPPSFWRVIYSQF